MDNTISIDHFAQCDLRVVTVKAAERVEGSEKLLKLTISVGEGERVIVAGIGKSYDPSALVGRQCLMILNLEPRQLMGIESQGMLLATGESAEEVSLLIPDRSVPAGSKIH